MPVELLTCVSTHTDTHKHTLAHHSHTTGKEEKEENDLNNSKHPGEPLHLFSKKKQVCATECEMLTDSSGMNPQMSDNGLVCIIISCLHRISATNTSKAFQLSEHKGLIGHRHSAQHPCGSLSSRSLLLISCS